MWGSCIINLVHVLAYPSEGWIAAQRRVCIGEIVVLDVSSVYAALYEDSRLLSSLQAQLEILSVKAIEPIEGITDAQMRERLALFWRNLFCV